MILDLLLKNKFKIILIIGVFFLVSSIVSAQYELGCCVGRTDDGSYCNAVEETECNILEDVGKWFSGPDYYDNNMNCVDLPSDYSSYCSIICCNINDRGEEMTRIECTDKNGEFAGLKCPTELTELKWCLLNNKCDERTERQCKNADGEVKKDKEECEKSLGVGCIVSSDGKTCRAGYFNTLTTGESFINSRCYEISNCKYYCGEFKWVCIDGVEHQENLCGDIISIRKCNDLEYCDEKSERCTVDNCKTVHIDKISWCEIPTIEFPRDRHKKVECAGGGEVATKYCGEFRETICKESVDKYEKINADCVNNEWDSCFNQNEAICNDNSHKDFCLWSNNECLPRYPPGVEFWLGESVLKEDKGKNTQWNDLMCSKTSEEGCKRSGDCEGGSGVGEAGTIQVTGELDCGYGNCFLYIWDGTAYDCAIMKKEECTLEFFGSGSNNFVTFNKYKSEQDALCETTELSSPGNCPTQNILSYEGDEVLYVNEGESWIDLGNKRLKRNAFCKCGNTFCKLSGGGICKT